MSALEPARAGNACSRGRVRTICAQLLESWSLKMENIISKSPTGKNMSTSVSVYPRIVPSVSSISVSFPVSCLYLVYICT